MSQAFLADVASWNRSGVTSGLFWKGSTLATSTPHAEDRVAVLVDCDNTSPEILEHALQMAARHGRVVLRRGYGNHATLGNKWKEALVRHAFTPHLQYQYAAGKNTADIALALDALEAMFDQRAETFCLITSDSDFAYLCRKLRERGAKVCIVGESKTPDALRNASDSFIEWSPAATVEAGTHHESKSDGPAVKAEAAKAKPVVKQRPRLVVKAVEVLASDASESKVDLGTLGQYLKRTDSAFSPSAYGHSGLLNMLKTYDLLVLKKEEGGHYTVRLRQADEIGESAVN